MPALLSSSRLQPAPSAEHIATSSVTPRKHPRYYMPQGDVVIRVQDALFKVDLSVLHEKSPVLQMITPPQYAGKMRLCGFDDDHPFLLHDITEAEFVRLLWVLFPSNSHPFTMASIADWVSILKLAHKYQIDDVRELAVLRLHASHIDPIRKIAIWDQYHLDTTLLTSSYVALCQRVEPLTLAMTMTIGLKNFTKLAAARDMYHQRLTSDGCCKSFTPEQKRIIAEDVVKQNFLKYTRHSI
ncbi:hypothetical protein H0H81_006337 [Sphagnurus paluster]|uniref:BTB domain-containing protein n=1 Tax=Sphagnurus paluster TaxID=117069 RepID=A0A9P7K3N6_9AGAR|nr:hypothetical protein H0H81_006337 [Sphagnurus paluster]